MLIAIVVFCVLLEAIFTALEVAVGAISRARLRGLTEVDGESTPKQLATAGRARRTLRTLDHAPRMTLLFIIVTSLSMWIAASLLTWQSLLGEWPLWALPLALVATLFVAEVLPVLIAAPRAEAIALRGTALIEGASTLLAPLIWLVGSAAHGLAQLLGARGETTPQVTEDEVRSALAAAEEEGAIESNERAFLEGAIDFRAKTVREVMTTRLDIVGVTADTTLHEILSMAIAEGHSRLPVYDGTLDNILGIASTKDLIPHLRQSNGSNGAAAALKKTGTVAREIVRPAFFVPENKLIAATLDDLRRQRTLMAVVVDDDGSTSGIVTLEDLLEEIVGEIQDEYDEEEPPLVVSAPGAVRCEASTSVRECRRFWKASFDESLLLYDDSGQPAEDSNSLAALALRLFDGVPTEGQSVSAGEVEPGAPVQLTVLSMSGPRIEAVQLETEVAAQAV